jgi:hypothetical protein
VREFVRRAGDAGIGLSGTRTAEAVERWTTVDLRVAVLGGPSGRGRGFYQMMDGGEEASSTVCLERDGGVRVEEDGDLACAVQERVAARSMSSSRRPGRSPWCRVRAAERPPRRHERHDSCLPAA